MVCNYSQEYKFRPFKNIQEFWHKSEIDLYNSNVITIAKKKDLLNEPIETLSFVPETFEAFVEKIGFQKLFDEYVYKKSKTKIFVPFAPIREIKKSLK